MTMKEQTLKTEGASRFVENVILEIKTFGGLRNMENKVRN